MSTDLWICSTRVKANSWIGPTEHKRHKRDGLIAYARRRYRLPSIKMVRDYQFQFKVRCDQSPIKRTNRPYYDSNGA